MFAYCLNNPVNFEDTVGSSAEVCFAEEPYVQVYGQGSAISVSIYNQSVYIEAYMTFHGDISPTSLIAGIKQYWEGTYANGTYTYNVFVTVHLGNSENGNTIDVYAYNDNFRGYCTWNPFTWSSTKESTIRISANYYSSTPYTWTIAHEFGHSLGVSDYYTQDGKPGFDKKFSSIMNAPGNHASFYDVLKVIDASRYSIRQKWHCVGGM